MGIREAAHPVGFSLPSSVLYSLPDQLPALLSVVQTLQSDQDSSSCVAIIDVDRTKEVKLLELLLVHTVLRSKESQVKTFAFVAVDQKRSSSAFFM